MLLHEDYYLECRQKHQQISVIKQLGLNDFIESLVMADSMFELGQICNQITDHYEYDNFVYVTNFLVEQSPQKGVIDGFPDGYIKRYYKDHAYKIDPAAIHCKHRVTSALWKSFSYTKDEKVNKFIDQAYDVGLRSGVNVPLHGLPGNFGILSIGCAREGEAINKTVLNNLPFIETLAGYLHETSHRILTAPQGPISLPKLSPRQIEVLQWAALGKSSWEIAHILSVSEHTVTMHIKNTMLKLGVTTRQHAIAKALVLKMITL